MKTKLKKLSPKQYYDLASNTYDEANKESFLMIGWDKITSSILKKYINNKSKILDLGCGTGFVLDAIKGRYKSYIGVDISEGMLKVAKKKYKTTIKKKSIKFIKHNLNKRLPFKSNSFDFVCSTYSSLSYVKNINLAIKEAYRVCKHNGYIYVSMLNRYALKRLLQLKYSKKEYYKSKTNEGDQISALIYYRTPQDILDILPTSRYNLELVKSHLILLDISFITNLISNNKLLVDRMMDFEEGINRLFPFTHIGHEFVIVLKKI